MTSNPLDPKHVDTTRADDFSVAHTGQLAGDEVPGTEHVSVIEDGHVIEDGQLREDASATVLPGRSTVHREEIDLDAGALTLLGERLMAGVERHEWSRVKVTRRVVTEQRTITVPVRREELVIEYPDVPAPKADPNTVKGSTDTVDSKMVEEFVLHQEEPRIVVEARPYEKVQLIVDQQRSLVRLEGEVSREHLVVDGEDELRRP